MNNAVVEFQNQMQSNGFTPPEIIADGKPHRFDIDKRGDKNGFYILFADGVPTGRYGSWSEQEPGAWFKWSAKSETKMTDAERKENKRRWKLAQIERNKQIEEAHRLAAEEALRVWDSSTPASENNDYLKRKGVKVHGIRQQGKNLIIPVRINGKLTSIQTIKPDGTKLFQKDGAIAGGYHSIGKPNRRIFIVEGYATAATVHEATGEAEAVAVAFNAGNLKPVAKAIRSKLPDVEIVIAGDNDKSGTGQKKAQAAADAVGGKVALPVFADDESGTDWNDYAAIHGLDAVAADIKKQIAAISKEPAKTATPDESLAETVRRLAELPPLEYDQVRAKEAERLGARTTTLDAEVKAARKETRSDDGMFPEVDQWPESVPGGALLDEIAATFRRYVILPKFADVVAALWILNTYVHDASYHSPMIVLTSPEKRCGKTTALTVFMALCNKPLPASNVSGAVVFRAIEQWHPTLLIDEVDSFLADKEDLRGVINSGHTKASAYALRCVGDNNEPKRFSTWCPKILSGIGKVSDTLEDRSILFPLRRKLSDEKVARLRLDRGGFDEIKQKCLRWAEDNSAKVAASDPATPSSLNDRAADNWTPLLAIADLCGWREQAEAAALALSGDADDSDSVNVMLLADVHKVFEARKVDRLPSQSICDELAKMEDRPWPEWYHGKPITPRALAKRLGGFGIHAEQQKQGDKSNKRGYEKADFEDAFTRYCIPSATTLQDKGHNKKQPFPSATGKEKVADRKTLKPLQEKGGSRVADRNATDSDSTPFDDAGNLPPPDFDDPEAWQVAI